MLPRGIFSLAVAFLLVVAAAVVCGRVPLLANPGPESGRVLAVVGGTLLDEVNHLLARAVAQRSRWVRLADRAARLYAPVVHVTALATFVGWLLAGLAWQPALVIAITVLIITCPCALGLAVPAVQVVCASAMFKRGVLLNSGEALERLAGVDTIIFDKTGTLTLPKAEIANLAQIDPRDLAHAGALAAASNHPLARVIALAEALMQTGCDEVGLADTSGYANPAQVRDLVRQVHAAVGRQALSGLHLHNTRGLGLANVIAGLEVGITTFDSSLGGLGGCPFAPGASGNIVTEDLVFMMEAMGLRTGIDLPKLLRVRAILREALPGEPLYGFTPDAGLPLGFTQEPRI
jgi:hypothetical protein